VSKMNGNIVFEAMSRVTVWGIRRNILKLKTLGI
jgi:hypothetical protein